MGMKNRDITIANHPFRIFFEFFEFDPVNDPTHSIASSPA
jgi:hypothetical protein